MSLRDKIEHAIQNQPCMVKDLKAKFGGDRAADRMVMEAVPKRPCPARFASWARTLPL